MFRDRTDAGSRLAEELSARELDDPVLLALPRGGVPVAAEIARRTGWPLEIVVSRKLGVPWQPELGFGAVAEGTLRWLDPRVLRATRLDRHAIETISARESEEVKRRVQRWRGGATLPDLRGRTAVLVDDGIATGGTLRAALAAVRASHPARIVIAAPVAARDVADSLAAEVDALVCIEVSDELDAIGAWYHDFRQVSDEQVDAILERRTPDPPGEPRQVIVPAGGARLEGVLQIPGGAVGVVVFAHGSGSSRFSPRNRMVAERLRAEGLGTMLFDLLTHTEENLDRRTAALRFDVPLLAGRVRRAVEWLASSTGNGLPIGLFGASTGAAAALVAAAERPDLIHAVVSRGGRPDLARDALDRVKAPTLLLVGDLDDDVVDLNRDALEHLEHGELRLVPGASHLFEEPGTLAIVAEDAARFLSRHLQAAGGRRALTTEVPHA